MKKVANTNNSVGREPSDALLMSRCCSRAVRCSVAAASAASGQTGEFAPNKPSATMHPDVSPATACKFPQVALAGLSPSLSELGQLWYGCVILKYLYRSYI